MKPLAIISRQLGLDTSDQIMESTSFADETPTMDFSPVAIPTGLAAMFEARAHATRDLAHAEWPRRGQILRLERPRHEADERPFSVLLTEPTASGNVWKGYVVAPDTELDYSGDGDILLEDLLAKRDPMAGFVQAWNPVHIPIPSATGCLAWLDKAAMDRVFNTIQTRPDHPIHPVTARIAAYRDLYQRAAEGWSNAASRLDMPANTAWGLFERLTAQLASLAQVAEVGQWRPAIEHPMGPEDGQQLIWNFADIEIHFNPPVCTIRRVGANDRPTQIDLFLDDLLLESHKLAESGATAVIQLAPEQQAGQLKLMIRQAGGGAIELVI